MSQCGITEFMKYGTISEADIVSSRITNSTVSASTIDAATVTNLASIDANSAERIATALTTLPPDQLSALALALAKALATTPVEAPDTTMDNALPTTMFGGREALLGKPSIWLNHDGYVVPGYIKS